MRKYENLDSNEIVYRIWALALILEGFVGRDKAAGQNGCGMLDCCLHASELATYSA
jgi:hypothetical protein